MEKERKEETQLIKVAPLSLKANRFACVREAEKRVEGMKLMNE